MLLRKHRMVIISDIWKIEFTQFKVSDFYVKKNKTKLPNETKSKMLQKMAYIEEILRKSKIVGSDILKSTQKGSLKAVGLQ